MKTLPQSTDAMRHLAEKLEPHRVAMLTLADAQGLGSRPMTPLEMDGDGALWMLTSRTAFQGLLGVEGGPANLSFTDAGDNDFISLRGHADLVEDAERRKMLWTVMARPWFSGPDDPDLVLLRVQPQQAEIWDGPDNAATKVLAMAASVIAGKEVGMGHKSTIDAPPLPR